MVYQGKHAVYCLNEGGIEFVINYIVFIVHSIPQHGRRAANLNGFCTYVLYLLPIHKTPFKNLYWSSCQFTKSHQPEASLEHFASPNIHIVFSYYLTYERHFLLTTIGRRLVF